MSDTTNKVIQGFEEWVKNNSTGVSLKCHFDGELPIYEDQSTRVIFSAFLAGYKSALVRLVKINE